MVSTTLFLVLALAPAQTRSAPTVKTKELVIPVRTLTLAQATERKVSLRVSDASLKDVLSKLPKVDYVVDADAFRARRITLNLTDVTTTEALNAIAAAIDAHWETVGGVRVLKRGAGFGLNGSALRTFTIPPTPGFQFFDGKGGKLPFRTFSPDLFKDFDKDGRTMPGLTPEQRKEMEKALEGARKSMQESRTELEKAMERSRLRGEGLRAPMSEETRKAIERYRSGGADANALLKSLTPVQKELAKSQRYLKLSDLTPEQRKMTGHEGAGTFEMRIVRDGETLTIKNG